jgi:protein-S-isoprenylcysteine O-methyltransferase Ste14
LKGIAPERLPSLVNQLVLVAAWIAFGALFALRRRNAKGSGATAERAKAGRLGLVLQAAGFAFAWWQRPNRGMVGEDPSPRDLLLTVAVVSLLAWSITLALAALRALGEQWALEARVLERHVLVTTGPYARVRHPIYTAMGGMLIATGLVLCPWWSLPVAILAYGSGTLVRTRAEETLLVQAFGTQYEAYRARVPAVVPWRRA